MAGLIGISAPYLSQLENDERPITQALADSLRATFPIEWRDISEAGEQPLHRALEQAAANPLLTHVIPSTHLIRVAEQFPQFAAGFAELDGLLRGNLQRLEMLDEAVGSNNVGGGRLPWEEVRDWFHLANNYVDVLDRGAEEMATRLSHGAASLSLGQMEQWLAERGVSIEHRTDAVLRRYDPARRILTLDAVQPAESLRFQLAYQVAAIGLHEEIAAIVGSASLRADAARHLLAVGLGNYAAGALLMPYGRFRSNARAMRHDIDRLRTTFGTSFEQTCQRLSTLQRPGERGTPMFFFRVDMAGNITKRHSATRLQFARYGGACPLWVVHEAAAVPERIHIQLAEMPDGVRYVSIAKGLVKPTGHYRRVPRRYAVALGCEAAFASTFVYADAINLDRDDNAVPIGASCRICPRDNCDQRAFPPSDRGIVVDPLERDLVPYRVLDDGRDSAGQS